MIESWMYLNGKIINTSRARVSPMDRGLLFGDGVFETLRVYDKQPFASDHHLSRLYNSLEQFHLNIPEPPEEIGKAVDELVEKNGQENCIIRITVTRGEGGHLGLPKIVQPTRMIHLRPLDLPSEQEYQRGVKAVVFPKPLAASPFIAKHKTLNYLPGLCARQFALEQEAKDGLIANANMEIVEGATANVIAVKGQTAWCPGSDSGALPGITRGICTGILVEMNFEIVDRPLPFDVVKSCDEIFLTNSVIEILPVIQIGEEIIGDGSPGPAFIELAKKYRDLEKGPGAKGIS